ncbi:Kelch repeat-containing protein [Shewanella sp.]
MSSQVHGAQTHISTQNSPASAAKPMLTYPNLPQAVSNNAVALIKENDNSYLVSFMGLGANKGYQDVHNHAWSLALSADGTSSRADNDWQALADVPYIAPLSGRLASVAIGIKDSAYIFGGYTVAEDHQELSTADNYRFNIQDLRYQRIADMPVAVDDSAAASYQDRYIYLFGGWHQDGNVNLVQVYDTHTDTWSQASPIPAPAVFGQAVGMFANQLVLCDGVKIKVNLRQKRNYQASPVCLFGEISPDNHQRIAWQLIPHYSIASSLAVTRQNEHKSLPSASAQAHYRMAATATSFKDSGQIIFMGGSSNPYNYNGIGYNGKPSEASNQQYSFDLKTKRWLKPIKLEQASMDHRGLICHNNQLLRIGGMTEDQQVSDKVLSSPLTQGQYCLP